MPPTSALPTIAPDRTERWMELVAIVKARAAVTRPRRCTRSARANAPVRDPPHRARAGTALDERPVNVEADTAQMHLLIHPVADARRTCVRATQPAVDRDPVAQPVRVHDQFPHVLRRRVDVDGCRDEAHRFIRPALTMDAHRAASGSTDSHSRSERSTADRRSAARLPAVRRRAGVTDRVAHRAAGRSAGFPSARSPARDPRRRSRRRGGRSAVWRSHRRPTAGRASIISSAMRRIISP